MADLDPHPDISALLSRPHDEIGLELLPSFFEITRLSYSFKRPKDVDTGPRLPAALRGALGRQLKLLCLTEPDARMAAAFSGLFADHGGLFPTIHFPKPFVIWADVRGEELNVDISLFGASGCWARIVHTAMTNIMKPINEGGEGGVTIDAATHARRMWDLEEATVAMAGKVAVPPPKKSFLLSTLTPLVLSNDGSLKGDFATLFQSLFIRIQGLAAWHNLTVTEFGNLPALQAKARQIRIARQTTPRPVSFARRSRNFGPMTRHENGLYLSLHVTDYPDELWPAFVLGTYVHFGYGVSQGAGRYVISDP